MASRGERSDENDRRFVAVQNLYHHAIVAKERAERSAESIREYADTRDQLLALGVEQAVSPTTPSSRLVRQPFEELAELVARALKATEEPAPTHTPTPTPASPSRVPCEWCENEVRTSDYKAITSAVGITEPSWLPGYLFRVYSTSSHGQNTPHCFHSNLSTTPRDHAVLINQAKFAQPGHLAHNFGKILNTHLEWLKTPTFRSPFISTTASLLFALQMAIRENADPRKNAKNVSIALISTSKLLPGQAHAAADLITATGSSLAPANYKEEYLILERIPPSAVIGNCTLETLVSRGLPTFAPWLFTKSLELQLRGAMTSHRTFVEQPRPILMLEVERAGYLAKQFVVKGDQAAMKCLLGMFLCLSAREPIPDVALGRERLLTFSLDDAIKLFGELNVRPPAKQLGIPELERFYDMVGAVDAARRRGRGRPPQAAPREGLKRSFSESSVGGVPGPHKARKKEWKSGGIQYPSLPE